MKPGHCLHCFRRLDGGPEPMLCKVCGWAWRVKAVCTLLGVVGMIAMLIVLGMLRVSS